MLEYLKDHVGGLAGGGMAGGGVIIAFAAVFKDGIKKIIDDWSDERRAKRAAAMSAAGHDDRSWTKLVELLTKSVEDQKANGSNLHALLERMVIANERGLDVQRMTSNQLSELDKRTLRMEGAMNSRGNFNHE